MRIVVLVGLMTLFGCGDSGSGGAGGTGSTRSAATTQPTSSTSAVAGSTNAQTAQSNASATATSASTGMASPGCGMPDTPGEREETLDVAGQTRTYTLHVPDAVTGMTAVPLIFGFHGFGGMGAQAAQYFGLTGDEAAIYVYPQALPLSGEGGVGWDMESDGVDVAFIDALIAELENTHCIDSTRVFAAGHSHGASFSNHLGCYRPAVFRAIAPVAGGGPWAGACTPGGVAAMLIHGTADDQVPIENGEDSRDHWLEEAGCAGAAQAPVDPPPCAAYQGCTHRIAWCEHDGGHEWPDFAGDGIRAFFLSF